MSPEPTLTPNPNGGPNTPEGRAISSLNATTFGLYARQDFVRPNEESAYCDLADTLRSELAPTGLLENNLVDAIRGAMWRLARCGEVERSFVADHVESDDATTLIPDPMRNETQAKLQLSVDRARSLYQRLLHKCTAELRKIQTERQLRIETFRPDTDNSHLGLCDWAFISKDLVRQTIAEYRVDDLGNRAKFGAVYRNAVNPPGLPGSFCETPRNAPCPCGSGQKHKRCCGRNAPPQLKAA